MLEQKDEKILRESFLDCDYIMTTAKLNKEKICYRDIQRMLVGGLIGKAKLGHIIGLRIVTILALSIDCFLIQFSV